MLRNNINNDCVSDINLGSKYSGRNNKTCKRQLILFLKNIIIFFHQIQNT